MLGWRLTVSAVLIPLLYVIFRMDHQAGAQAPWLFGLCLLLGARSSWELNDLLTTRGMKPAWPVALFGVITVVAAPWGTRWFGDGDLTGAESLITILLCLLCAGYATLISGAVRYREPGSTMEAIGAELFIVFYCGVLMALTAQMRWLGDGAWGYAALGSLIVATKCGDIGGYTLGRLFGKRKMAPRLSPGKTWAGFGGAILGASLGTWLWVVFAIPQLVNGAGPSGFLNVSLFGIAMGGVGLFGDLCESLVKRDVGRKDAAALFPGFGGLLDLLDSILFAGPLAWAWWSLWPLISEVH